MRQVYRNGSKTKYFQLYSWLLFQFVDFAFGKSTYLMMDEEPMEAMADAGNGLDETNTT